MPPWMIGRSIPRSSVMRVFIRASRRDGKGSGEAGEAERFGDERWLVAALDLHRHLALDQDLAGPAIDHLRQHETAPNPASRPDRRHHPHAVEAAVHLHPPP